MQTQKDDSYVFYFVLRNYTNKQWPLKANLVKHIECTLESRCNSLFKANLALTRAPVVVIVIKIIVLIMVIVILLRAAAACEISLQHCKAFVLFLVHDFS